MIRWYWIPITAAAMLLGCIVIAHAEQVPIDLIVEAIEHAENSTEFPYGVKQITGNGAIVWPYPKEEARLICLRSVMNNYIRWLDAGKPKPFLDFMADRWVPESEDPEGHAVWADNVRYWIRRLSK